MNERREKREWDGAREIIDRSLISTNKKGQDRSNERNKTLLCVQSTNIALQSCSAFWTSARICQIFFAFERREIDFFFYLSRCISGWMGKLINVLHRKKTVTERERGRKELLLRFFSLSRTRSSSFWRVGSLFFCSVYLGCLFRSGCVIDATGVKARERARRQSHGLASDRASMCTHPYTFIEEWLYWKELFMIDCQSMCRERKTEEDKTRSAAGLQIIPFANPFSSHSRWSQIEANAIDDGQLTLLI